MKKSNVKLNGSNNQPQAWIAIQKNRQKTYSKGISKEVFLKDSQEFQIELYNPTKNPVLAKIKINGSYISNRGLILDPGQRWFLDRYIDSDRKFSFATYEVKNNKTNREAISNNGLVSVEFYDEYKNNGFVVSQPYWQNDWNRPFITYSGQTTNPIWYTAGATTIANPNFSSSSSTTSSVEFIPTSATSFYSSSMDISEISPDAKININSSLKSNIETGRVKEGEKSDQSFIDGSGSFNTWTINTVNFKLLPISTKPIEKGEMRNYCPECRSRIRKSSWKFCPSCGGDLQ